MDEDNNLDQQIVVNVPATSKTPAFTVPAHVFWDVYEAITKAGTFGAGNLAVAVAWLLKNERASPDEAQRLMDFIGRVKAIGDEWDSREDFVLNFTYDHLRKKKITRAQAAQLATEVLKKPYTTDAWRLKVDRWAEDVAKLPKVGIRKRGTK